MSSRKLLGEILVEMDACTTEQVKTCLALQVKGDSRLIGAILVDQQFCSPEDVARAIAEQVGARYYDLEAVDIPPQIANLVPAATAREKLLVPVTLSGKTLTVAMANPLDLDAVDTLRFTTSLAIEVAVASERQIKDAIERMHGLTEGRLDQELHKFAGEDISVRTLEESDAKGDDAPIIKFVTQLISSAYDARASDIHVEPMLDHLRVRYRIDGVCFVMDPAPKKLQGPVIQRIKIMANMMVEEKRRPQGGRIKMRLGSGKEIDLRVSSLPAVYGECIVMRILDSGSLKLSLDDMGFDATDLKVFQQLIKRPNGIILVTGPTGSGKTTTLYATLNTLNTIDRKIITAEDPVEYHLSGINQCQIQHKIGLDFPRILRAMLRQAPNVILVGEIRDAETAQIAIQASLTGHLVFSTLHTNDAPSAITRLIDMGVPPFLVATSIQAIVAQRLIRTICPKCSTPFTPEPAHIAALGLKPGQTDNAEFRHGAGCDYCKNSGFRGRKGVFEMMVMNRHLRELAFAKASASEVRKAAMANGMVSLAQDGARKALQGITTPEEVIRTARIDT